jgi:hypothetical protein
MRRYRRKLLCLILACGMLPAFFLSCNKAALNLQRGFWQGLGADISEFLAAQVGVTEAQP